MMSHAGYSRKFPERYLDATVQCRAKQTRIAQKLLSVPAEKFALSTTMSTATRINAAWEILVRACLLSFEIYVFENFLSLDFCSSYAVFSALSNCYDP